MLQSQHQSGGRKDRGFIHLEMGGWVPLLSVDEARKLERRGRRGQKEGGREEMKEGMEKGSSMWEIGLLGVGLLLGSCVFGITVFFQSDAVATNFFAVRFCVAAI